MLERADGALAAIEVKATDNPSEHHIRSLQRLRDRLERTASGLFRIGVLMHTGPHCHRVKDRLWLGLVNTL